MRVSMIASLLLLCGLVAVVAAADSTAASASASTASSVQLSSTDSLTHFTFGSCNKHDKPQPMWQHIIDRQPQMWIWLGDVIYADSATLEFFRRPSPLSSMERMYRQQYTQANYTLLRQSATRIVGVYDDHDYGVNDGDATYPDKEPARQLFMDFVDEPKDSARRNRAGGGVYESYRWGATKAAANSTSDATTSASSVAAPAAATPLADGRQTKLILLDSRFFQDGARDDMLGDAQWSWLEGQIEDASAPTDLYVVGSGVQLVSRDKHIGEGWRLLPKSRARILDLFANRRANPQAMVLFLSGDVHFAESDVTYLTKEMPDGQTRVTPFYEVTSSGLTHSVGSQVSSTVASIILPLILDQRRSWAEDTQNEAAAASAAASKDATATAPSASIRGFYSGLNFGDVKIDWEAEQIMVSIIGVDGLAQLGYTLPFWALRSRLLSSAEVPLFVREVAAAEELRARSPPMWVIPGVKAGLLIVALVLAALAAALMLLVRCCRASSATKGSNSSNNGSNQASKIKRAQAAAAASDSRKQR